MKDCIFCQIIAGDIPAAKVYEDDQVLAFLDITQVTPGHTLVVPKVHARNLIEMSPEASSSLFASVPRVARKIMNATDAIGMNIVNNNEEIAGQTVFHTHVHLLPRFGEDDEFGMQFTAHEPDFPAMNELAARIAATDE